MWSQIKRNPYKWHSFAYCMSQFGYGLLLVALGPLIPFLAYNQHASQTDFSFLFLAKSLGIIIGAILVKLFQHKWNYHKILMVFSTLIFVTYTLFSFSTSMIFQGIFMFFGSIFSSITAIIFNIAMLASNTGQYQQFYLQIGHGMFGVGGIISPLIVAYFQLNAYIVVGFVMFMVTPAYFFLQSPQLKEKDKKSQILQKCNLVDEIKSIEQTLSQRHSNTLLDKDQINSQQKSKICILISLMLMIYIAQDVAYSGWIPSYAVLTNIATKQEAAIFSSLFWIFMTVFRFVFAVVRIKPSIKLKNFIKYQLIISVMVLIFIQIFNLKALALYFASISYGIAFSSMFGLFFVLPGQFGVEMTCQQGSKFMLYGQLGQGLISIVGYLMSWFTPNMLFYSMLLLGILLYWAFQKALNKLKYLKKQKNISVEMKTRKNKMNINPEREMQQGKDKQTIQSK